MIGTRKKLDPVGKKHVMLLICPDSEQMLTIDDTVSLTIFDLEEKIKWNCD